MARVAIIALLALVAGAGVANAKLAICNAKARPAKPTNVVVTRNMITPQGAELTVQWNNPTTGDTGCIDFFRVQTFVNGRQVSEEGVQLSNPTQMTASLLKKGIQANSMAGFKVYAMNRATQKKSDIASSSSVKAASGGATTGRRLMA
ncbi:hypothetical protein OEZ85_008962 [Tetradesmus obliquus]|uniref:Fibronectin type-III domain-containing protein n=1 Tax=Tetradesmus obliquus TaxID=3088 RepID=A0ABY8TKN9_TETOB|nr:hypothetical protein OEZ85_008962 [Tetradesmus obliquus]